jgi:hypothetical protein
MKSKRYETVREYYDKFFLYESAEGTGRTAFIIIGRTRDLDFMSILQDGHNNVSLRIANFKTRLERGLVKEITEEQYLLEIIK